MTALSDHCDTIRSWLNLGPEIYPDSLIESWTKMFEEDINVSLRVKHMIAIDRGEVIVDRVLLPSDWVELDFVRVVDGKPLRFRDRNLFYTPNEQDQYDNSGYYTITGNYLIVGGPISITNSKTVEISYYQNVPRLGEFSNWMMDNYSRLYTTGTLAVGSMYSFEDERGPAWATATQVFVDKLNEEHLVSKHSGSVLIKGGGKRF